MPHIVLRWDGESDGDSSHRPTGVNAAAHRPADPEYELLYRQKLGQQLMIDNGRAQQGKQLPKPCPYDITLAGTVCAMLSRR